MTETAKLEALTAFITRYDQAMAGAKDLGPELSLAVMANYGDQAINHLRALSRPAVKDDGSLAASVMRITAKVEGLFGYIDMSQDGAKEAWADWCAEKETAWSLSLSSLSPPTGGWKPIESAPRDRTPIIIAVPTKDRDDHIVGEAYFDPEHDDGDWWWAGTGHGDYHGGPISEMNHHLPTHWQPLPSPPEAE